jgi:hypothetical protein
MQFVISVEITSVSMEMCENYKFNFAVLLTLSSPVILQLC